MQNLKSLLLVWFLKKKSKTQIVKEYTALQQQFGDVKDSVVAVYPSGNKT